MDVLEDVEDNDADVPRLGFAVVLLKINENGRSDEQIEYLMR